MSELLEEARERRDKAELSTESPSYNWLDDSYYLGEQVAWREAVELIEKHEKPKGLLEVVPSSLEFTKEQRDMYKSLKESYEIYKRVDEPAISGALAETFPFGYIPEDDAVVPVLKKFINEVEE